MHMTCFDRPWASVSVTENQQRKAYASWCRNKERGVWTASKSTKLSAVISTEMVSVSVSSCQVERKPDRGMVVALAKVLNHGDSMSRTGSDRPLMTQSRSRARRRRC